MDKSYVAIYHPCITVSKELKLQKEKRNHFDGSNRSLVRYCIWACMSGLVGNAPPSPRGPTTQQHRRSIRVRVPRCTYQAINSRGAAISRVVFVQLIGFCRQRSFRARSAEHALYVLGLFEDSSFLTCIKVIEPWHSRSTQIPTICWHYPVLACYQIRLFPNKSPPMINLLRNNFDNHFKHHETSALGSCGRGTRG